MIKMMIAAPSSDSGKTMVTCGMLSLLSEKGYSPCAFKCGPDYIDPMFHRSVMGIDSHNLDLFMCEKTRAKEMFSRYTAGHGAAVVEGVMGYYDGLTGKELRASAYDVARTMDIPALLVVRPKGTALTLAALIKGMAGFRDPSMIKGVILNECPKAIYDRFAKAYEEETGIPVIGHIPHVDGSEFSSRHLGLYTAGEIEDLGSRLAKFTSAMKEGIDFERLKEIFDDGEGSETGAFDDGKAGQDSGDGPVIAVARDAAFNFIYEETLDTLRDLGARIEEFSPLSDSGVPDNADGLYIPGGYPELYAEELEKNSSMRKSVRKAVEGGMPVIAECGGFLYLGKSIEDSKGVKRDMAGVFPGEAENTEKLVRFGYAMLKTDKDSLILKAGEKLPVHEFHYWDSTDNGEDLTCEKYGSEKSWTCGFANDTVYAGFPHLYLAGSPETAERFVRKAAEHRK